MAAWGEEIEDRIEKLQETPLDDLYNAMEQFALDEGKIEGNRQEEKEENQTTRFQQTPSSKEFKRKHKQVTWLEIRSDIRKAAELRMFQVARRLPRVGSKVKKIQEISVCIERDYWLKLSRSKHKIFT